MSDFEDRNSELRDLFFESAYELLQALNEEALKLEATPATPKSYAGSVGRCTR